MPIPILFFIIALVLLSGLEIYAYQATKVLLKNSSPVWKQWVPKIYLGQAIVMLALLITLFFVQRGTQVFIFGVAILFMASLGKLLAVLVILADDIRRVIKWFFQGRKRSYEKAKISGDSMPRSKFLAKSAVALAFLPVAAMSFGIISGAYDYRIRRRKVFLPQLPKSMEGLKVAQLSDIHSGSFFDKKAVAGGIDLLMNEKPDAIFFTGDLVNNETKEVRDYQDVFSKLKADLGVYSTLGNHDYGDYKNWNSQAAKRQNLADMIKVHQQMGWRLLMNENEQISLGNDQLSIIGVENWGAGRFAKYGNLERAMRGAEGDVKILLSHDPSHWDAQVRPMQPDIDLTLSGHTHGMQLGVEIGDWRWSPSQYIYKQWADLYRQNDQYLYVNRGFGFLGFPGRIGILPEITILELTGRPV